MSKMTTINTTYARICILLLAVNFVLTGYAITEMARLQTDTGEIPATVRTQSPAESPAESAKRSQGSSTSVETP